MLLGSLVAARFLSLVAHFVITITIFWAKVNIISMALCSISLQNNFAKTAV
jgi:hypothetical protein